MTNDPFPVGWFSLALAIVAVSWIRYAVVLKKREKNLAVLAMEYGLSPCPDDSLCQDLYLADSNHLSNWSKLWNVYEGKINGVFIVFFDCRVGEGKGSFTRTVIAAKNHRDVFGRKLLTQI